MKLSIPSLAVLFCSAVLGATPGQSVYEPYSFTTLSTTGASLKAPKAAARDAAGNIYVANNDHAIIKITPLGVATVFAGQPGTAGSADGTGTAARFTGPQGIAVDAGSGTVYVADSSNHTIRKITNAGVVTTFAGSPGASGAANGTGAAARFARPWGLAVDSAGNIYVADSENSTIRRITQGAVVTTLAGLAGNAGFSDGTGSAARFNNPSGVAVDGAGQMYVADSNNHIIRKITAGGEVSTLAGVPLNAGFQDNQGCARFFGPDGVAVDNDGNVFVADTGNSLIRKVTAAGMVTTLGGKIGSTGSTDGVGSEARFNNPQGVTIYSGSQLLVVDSFNSILRIGTPAPHPTPIFHTVTNTNDSGPGSLRQAISDAQSGDTIDFSSSLNGQAITLTSGELTISRDVSIVGPGADLLAVERSAQAATLFRLFHIPPNCSVRISGLTMRNGDAHGSAIEGGGAIYVDRSTVAVDGCMFMNNAATYGGALCNSGTNAARGTLIVANTTFQGNSATSGGGGIFNSRVPDGTETESVAYAFVTNCTFSANAATGGGGAILNYIASGGNRVEVLDSTFSGNYAASGTAIQSSFAVCSVGNSIFKGTGDGSTVVKSGSNPPFEDRGYNVLSDYPRNVVGGPLFGSSTTQLNTDPRLGPLQNNGGHTLTHAPLVDSPAIDRGKDLALDVCLMPLGVDQRGFPRPVRFNAAIPEPSGGDGSDVGAVELSGPAPTLGNISTRLSVGTGENVLIGGFIVEGAAPKKVLIRARGPSLSGFVANPLPNPRLELHDSTSTLANNNDWQSTQIGGVITADQRQEIENSGLAPGNSAESAIIATLPPGNYTAVVQDVNGVSGVGIVEVFDLGPNASSRLANISTRGFVQTGDNVMIGGIIVVSQPARVIVRARGPSLGGAVSSPLPNPILELHDQSNLIARNDDWQITQIGGSITADQSQEIQNSGFAPANSAESAMIVTVQPGAYTAIVRDANGASGIGIVEVFILP
ncbi:MAG: hypothetical protein QOD80_299 [Verrucomicrobiota bacterium]